MKNKVIRQDVYAGISTDISYSVITAYDNKGNVIYTRNPEGAEHYYSYANIDCENQFTDSKGLQVSLFTDSFYTNNIPSECHNLIVGEAYINNGKAQETYYKYDANGNLTENKTLFPTRDYVVFSGTFDENGQTTFDFDLTGLTVTNGILVISSIAVPTQETLHETHSEIGNGWLNSGTWDEENFMADYLRCIQDPLDCWEGETEIGPFKHYPGTPHYNELLSISDGTTFTYDEMGNTLTKSNSTDSWSYTYGKHNQLTQVEKNQQILAQYTYDGNGYRIKKTEWIESLQDYQSKLYVYSGLNVIYERNPDTGQEAIYIYGRTGRIAKKVEGLTDYYHTDYLGSTRLITNELGNIVAETLYKPFGEIVTTGEEDPYLYNGKEKDITGLYYYGARYYDSEIGRFITRDPGLARIYDPSTLNRYTYCANNPVKYINPDGCDYFRPEWGQGHDKTWNLGWAILRYLLWEFEKMCKLLTAQHNFAEEHGFTYRALQGVGLIAFMAFITPILGGGPVVAGISIIFFFWNASYGRSGQRRGCFLER